MNKEQSSIAEKFAKALCKDSYGEKTMEGTLHYFMDAISEVIHLTGLDMIHCDTNHPFYKETMAQAENLKAIARREVIECDPTRLALEAAARKLEYMAQRFTHCANLAASELARKRLQERLTVLVETKWFYGSSDQIKVDSMLINREDALAILKSCEHRQ